MGFVEEFFFFGIIKLIFFYIVFVWEDEYIVDVDESKLKEVKIYLEFLVG